MSTDEGKVAQILRNFLTNAAKFTERGEICVGVQHGSGESLVFSVKDSGIGIAAEHLNRIFDEYGQIDNPLQNRAKGVGLGLPLTRKLAQLAGRRVFRFGASPAWVRSFLPRYRECSPVKPSMFRASTSYASPARHRARCRVEIHRPPMLAAIGQARFAREGADRGRRHQRPVPYPGNSRGARANSRSSRPKQGVEALSLARTERPDVIFLDLLMPDMTGFEILKRLKSDAETRNIPVIIHTSKILDEEERGQLDRSGRRPFCTKATSPGRQRSPRSATHWPRLGCVRRSTSTRRSHEKWGS